ncbi:MAG: DUF222 domain-containing protein, partial [Streptosporangiaceae bacterium]
LAGDLTPQCAAALRAVLDALGKRAGPEDARSKRQRDHDALEEACRRLIAAGGLPGRAGQPTQILLHLTLDDLLNQHGAASNTPGSGSPDGARPDSALTVGSGPDGSGPDGTGPGSAISPGPARPQGSRTDAGGAAWGPWWPGSAPAGPGADCDATIMPIITGRIDTQALDRLTADLLHRDPGTGNSAGGGQHPSQRDRHQPGQVRDPAGRDRDERARRAARDLAASRAVALLSGPGGLAAFLRTGHPSDLISPPSLPLDVGAPTPVIPPHLRRAVTARDRRCRFPGCDQPPAACQPHHLIPRAEGGTTSLANLLLLCSFHHLIAIHRQDWAITLHPDGDITAISPDRTRTLRSHDPPTSTTA